MVCEEESRCEDDDISFRSLPFLGKSTDSNKKPIKPELNISYLYMAYGIHFNYLNAEYYICLTLQNIKNNFGL